MIPWGHDADSKRLIRGPAFQRMIEDGVRNVIGKEFAARFPCRDCQWYQDQHQGQTRQNTQYGLNNGRWRRRIDVTSAVGTHRVVRAPGWRFKRRKRHRHPPGHPEEKALRFELPQTRLAHACRGALPATARRSYVSARSSIGRMLRTGNDWGCAA